MDIKSKSKPIYAVIFLLSILMLGLSLLSIFDIIHNKDYITKDYYFKSNSFKGELEGYFTQIENLDSNKDFIDAKRLDLNNPSFKCYIKSNDNKSVYTDIEDLSDINKYLKDNALYYMDFPQDESSDYAISQINNWFINNKLKGKIIVSKDASSYNRVMIDYKYYNSVKNRLLKEVVLGAVSLIVGILLLLLCTKIQKENSLLGKITCLYERIPLDIRVIIFFFITEIFMNIITSFFSFPVTFKHVIILVFFCMYVIYIIANLKSLAKIIRNTEERHNQVKGSLIFSFYALIKESLAAKGMVKKVILLFLITGITGGFCFIAMFGLMQGNTLGRIAVILAFFILLYFAIVPIYVLRKIAMLSSIIKATDNIADGKFDCVIEEKGKGNLPRLACNINNMKEGFKKSVEEQIKSERLKSELITNVSHDLKTPLTSIINYVDLLKSEELSPDDRKNYIDVLDKKSQRLKVLIEDLFEASKLASGSIELKIEKLDIVQLLNQALGEFDEKIAKSKLNFKVSTSKPNIYLNLDGNKTWRVFDNLIGNTLKYAQPDTRVYLDITEYDEKIIVTMKNISAYEMDFDEEEIFERFKRGDKSRNTEGSGLGLAISKNIIECEGGSMQINIDGDLFKVIMEFNKSVRAFSHINHFAPKLF